MVSDINSLEHDNKIFIANVVQSDCFQIVTTIAILALEALALYKSNSKLIQFYAFFCCVGSIVIIRNRSDAVSQIAYEVFTLFQQGLSNLKEQGVFDLKKEDIVDLVKEADVSELEEQDESEKFIDSSVTYTCGGRTFKAKDVEKKCSYYGMKGCDEDDKVNKAYKELLALRKSDPDKEGKRLFKTVDKVAKVFSNKLGFFSYSTWTTYGSSGGYYGDKEYALSLGHAIEISEKFKKKYYTLIHGESAEFTLMHLVAKKLEQVVGKDFWEGNYVFRHDCFRRDVQSPPRYQDKFWSQPLCDIATASGYFKVGAGTSTGFLQTIVKDVFSSKVASSVLKKLQQLDKAVSPYVKGHGSFCVLCVPKDKILGCLTGGNTKASLNASQNGTNGAYGEQVTVLRIDKMTPKNGMLSFHECPCLTMDQTKKINDCVHKIINAAIKGEDLKKVAIPTL